MATVTLKCAVIGYHFDHMADGEIHWAIASGHSGQLDNETLHVQQATLTVEVPDLNVVERRVAGLEAAKIKALEDYQRTVADINERLSKLQAITHEV